MNSRSQRPPRHALSTRSRSVLAAYLRRELLLGFDFDGTLAPIIPEPQDVVLPPRTALLLGELACRRPCVVITGRARADAAARLAGIPLAEIVGNHGSEPYAELEPLQEEVRRWLPFLQERLQPFPGAFMEDKGSSVSIHFRNAAHQDDVVHAIRAAAQELGVKRIIPGKCVLNLLPMGALDKGTGLLRAMQTLGKSQAIYVGDDSTDEDVFALPEQAGVLGIRVQSHVGSHACMYLDDQSQVEELLRFLLEALR